MFTNMAGLLGFVSVRETETHIIIDGISGVRFSKDLSTYWKTTRLAKYMFTSIRSSQIKFPKFYAIEVLYMLEQLLQSRRMFTPRRALQKAVDELLVKTWLRKIGSNDFKSKLDLTRLRDLNVTLFVHQNNFLREYDRITQEYSLRGMLMDVAAGGGKTISNLSLGHCLGADTQIFVVPKNAIVNVWEKTLRTLFKNGVPEYWISASDVPPVIGKPFYLVHYEYLEKFLTFAKANKRAFGKVFMAIDESHNFNEESGRTSYLIDLCRTLEIGDVVHASGTPFKAMGSEASTLLATTCPDFTDEAKEGFRKIFGKEAKRANEILANRIGILSFKVIKSEIETPGVDYFTITPKIPNGNEYTLDSIRTKMSAFIDERMKFYQKGMPEYQKLYDQCMDVFGKTLKNDKDYREFKMYQDYIKQIRRGYDPVTMKDMVMFCNRYELKNIAPSLPDSLRKPFINVRAIIKYVELKVLGEALSTVLGKLRMQCHLDMIDYMGLEDVIDNAAKKTVIFTSYVEVVKALSDKFTKGGYKPLEVYGETNKDLPAILKKFESLPDVNPLIATFKSLSTAVPLVMANTLVFTNSPFRDFERTQTIARVDRIGQDHRCHVFDVFLDTGEQPNISTRSKDILQWSKNQVEAILGVQSPDDIESSLESLIENPSATLVSAEEFIDQLRNQLPADASADIEASMEGWFSSNAPSVNYHDPRAIVKVLKETYLNPSWRGKQKWKAGKVTLPLGHELYPKALAETKRVLNKLVSESKSRSTNLKGDADSFVNGAWKDPNKVARWKAGIHTDTHYGSRSKQEVSVIAKFGPLEGMTNYVQSSASVNYLSDDKQVADTAQILLGLLTNKAAIINDLQEEDFSPKRFKYFYHDSEDGEKLLDEIESSDLPHKKDAIEVYHAIQNTIKKVEADFSNSPEMKVFQGHFENVYKLLWTWLTRSTK